MSKICLTLCLLLAGALALGCQEKTEEKTSEVEDQLESPCVLETLLGQPTRRFSTGSTYFLPRLDSDEETCASSGWQLVSAPDGNTQAPIPGADGYTRLTPLLPGTYRFEVEELTLVVHLIVIAAEEVPFDHYNYYPSASLIRVQDELWVANTYAHSVSRLDLATLEDKGTIPVGPWPVALSYRPSMDVVLVAHKADDTLGFIDVEAGALADAIWVGDEPSNIVVSPDGKTAYVSLSTEGALAVVDVAERKVSERIAINPDPLAMAMTDDGQTLYVATHRSAQQDREPYAEDPSRDEQDIAIIDTATRTVTGFLASVGSTISGLLAHDERLFVTVSRIQSYNIAGSPEDDPPFRVGRHRVVVFDTVSHDELVQAELSTQSSSTGVASTPHGLAWGDGVLWITAEGSDVTVGVDPVTLEEKFRFDTPGRPRCVLAIDDRVAIHGAQDQTVTLADSQGEVVASQTIAGDLRSAAIANGQRFFTGGGDEFGYDMTCNTCHVDALMDGNAWSTGAPQKFYELGEVPETSFFTARALFWLDGTSPLGWEGYKTDLVRFATSVPPTTIGVKPVQEDMDALVAYLGSLVPPPTPNGRTHRDGSMTDAALRGEAVFFGKGNCVSCHPGRIATNREAMPDGVSPGKVDVPSLVGVYRHGYWLKSGEPGDLGSVVDQMLNWTGNTSLSPDEKADLTAYLEQRVAREFFLLSTSPNPTDTEIGLGACSSFKLVFSHSVEDSPENLARVSILDANGDPVGIDVEVEGRRMTLTPQAKLTHGQEYRLHLSADLESFWLQTLDEEVEVSFSVADQPGTAFEKRDYLWTLQVGSTAEPWEPNLDDQPANEGSSEVSFFVVHVEPTDDGGLAEVVLTDDLSSFGQIVISGMQLSLPSLTTVTPAGVQNFPGTWPTVGEVHDDDGDGWMDSATGVVRISGPGFTMNEIEWKLEPL